MEKEDIQTWVLVLIPKQDHKKMNVSRFFLLEAPLSDCLFRSINKKIQHLLWFALEFIVLLSFFEEKKNVFVFTLVAETTVCACTYIYIEAVYYCSGKVHDECYKWFNIT